MLLSFVASSRVRGQLLFHNRTIRSWSRLPLIRLSISFDTHRAHNTLPCRLFAAFKALIMHASGYLCTARTSTDFYFCHTLITPWLEDDQTKDLWVFVKRGVARWGGAGSSSFFELPARILFSEISKILFKDITD